MVKTGMTALALALLLGACGMRNPVSNAREGTAWGTGAFDSNGERIYFTATNEAGDRIPYSGGPQSGMMMMGGSLTCASCHGPDGRGGRHVMHMEVMDAPDIRWSMLAGGGQDDEGDHEQDEHAEEHENYTMETFREAVVEGRHPDGEALSQDMPRWDFEADDLADLAEYLKSLP